MAIFIDIKLKSIHSKITAESYSIISSWMTLISEAVKFK